MDPQQILNRLRDDEDRWDGLEYEAPARAPRPQPAQWRRISIAVVAGLAVGAVVAVSIVGLRGTKEYVPSFSTSSPAADPTQPTPTPSPTPTLTRAHPSMTGSYGPGHFPGGVVTKSNPWGIPSIDKVDDPNFEGPWDNHGILFGIDTGARNGATGQAVFDADGHPVRYVVASGDAWSAIADRFGGLYISKLNCVRRDPEGLYVGDIINLSPYTVTTVGTENGRTKSMYPLVVKGCLKQTGLPPQK